MPKGKKTIGENNGDGQCNWTLRMDDAVVDAYLHQHILRNKVNGTFTTHALNNTMK